MALLNPRADLMGVLEAAYAPEPDDLEWGRKLSRAVEKCFEAAHVAGISIIAHQDDYIAPRPFYFYSPSPKFDHERFWPFPKAVQPDVLKSFYPGVPFLTHHELVKDFSPKARALVEEARAGHPDAAGFIYYPKPGLAGALWVVLDEIGVYARGERPILNRIAAHLESAFRMRFSGEALIGAVLAPDGRLLDYDASRVTLDPSLLGARTLSVEKSRLRARRRDPDSLDDWRALVEGKYAIVPREDSDGKRYYFFVSNSPAMRSHVKLTEQETNAVSFSARGFTGKGAAYALGMSESFVSALLGRAAAKLGLHSRNELIAISTALFGVPPERVDKTRLTSAEKDILELLRRGLSNSEIAALRKRSKNTVANQVSSVLQKTGSASRRGLVTRPSSRPPRRSRG